MSNRPENPSRAAAEPAAPATDLCDAMVLCAGFGTRLAPLTDLVPKPLVPLGDHTLLAEIVARLGAAGVRRVAVNAHHLAEQIVRAAAGFETATTVRVEASILGTAGGVKGVRRWLRAPALIWNGDILATPPVDALLASARETGGACLAVAPRELGTGSVGLDAEGHIVRLRGEAFGVERSGADYVGIAAIGDRCLAALPGEGCLVADVWLPWLRSGGQIETRSVSGKWFDSGDLNSYLQSNFAWLEARGEDAFLGPACELEGGVEVRRSVIGAGAKITGRGLVQDVVVWPGATLRAPARAVVALPSGRIVAAPRGGTEVGVA